MVFLVFFNGEEGGGGGGGREGGGGGGGGGGGDMRRVGCTQASIRFLYLTECIDVLYFSVKLSLAGAQYPNLFCFYLIIMQ